MMRLSVLIPTYRRPGNLRACLEGLQRQSRLADEILVACRTDDRPTQKMLQAAIRAKLLPGLRMILLGTANASEARNRALECATGEIIAMLDDDTVPHPGWLSHIETQFAADPKLGGLGGPDWSQGVVVPPAKRPRRVGVVQWFGRRIGNHHCGAVETLDVEWLKGANMSFRRAALPAAPFGRGLHGRGAQFAEDVALSLQVKRAGWTLRYHPLVAVDHYHGALMAEADHRRLSDPRSLQDATYNEAIAVLGYLSGIRRAAFLLWSVLIGTRLLPGLIATIDLTRSEGIAVWRRFSLVVGARWRAWRDWHRSERELTSYVPKPIPRRAPTDASEPPQLRICLVTHAVVERDGQGRVNLELARYLLSRGHLVTIVAGRVEEDLRVHPHLTWVRIPVPPHLPEAVGWVIFAIISWWRMATRLDRFDVVHLNGAISPLRADVNTSHFVHSSSRRLLPAAQLRRPIVRFYQHTVTAISSYCERRAYPAARRVVAVSDAVRQSLLLDAGVPGNMVEVVPVGVDTERFRPRAPTEPSTLRTELSLPADAFLLLYVGDAKSPRKNLDLALQVSQRLDQRFHLAVLGEWRGGPYRELTESLGLSARVHFLGLRADVARYYREADALICVPHYEPASLVLLEAMASGLPVIATSTVGNAIFVVDQENGFVVSPDQSADRILSIIHRLASDQLFRQRIGAAARKTVSSLTWRRMGAHYESIYFGIGRHHAASASAA